jgi:hypothetical protein
MAKLLRARLFLEEEWDRLDRGVAGTDFSPTSKKLAKPEYKNYTDVH